MNPKATSLFTDTKSNFSYLPQDKPLLESTGELSKHAKHELNCISKPVFHRILEYAQHATDSLLLSTLPRDGIVRVSMTLEDTSIPYEKLTQSQQLHKLTPSDIYYRMSQHPDLEIPPLNPIDGLLSIHTPEYTSVITQNGAETIDEKEDTYLLTSTDTTLSFYLEPEYSEKSISSWLNSLQYPECDITVISSDSTELTQFTPDDTVSDSVPGFVVTDNSTYTSIYRTGKNYSYRGQNSINGFYIKKRYTGLDYSPILTLDVHIHENTGRIVFGEHSNKIPIPDDIYSTLPTEFAKYAISESDVNKTDVKLPHTTNIVSRMTKTKDFFQICYEDAESKLYRTLRDLIPPQSDIAQLTTELETQEVSLIYKTLRKSDSTTKSLRTHSNTHIKNHIEAVLGYPTQTTISTFKEYLYPIYESDIQESPFDTKKSEMTQTSIGLILNKARSITGDVYMAVSPQVKKNKVLHQDSDTHILIKIGNASNYSKYESSYGWIKQKEITDSNIDSFDITEDLKSEFEKQETNSEYTPRPDEISQRKLNIHLEESGGSSKYTLETVKSIIDEGTPYNFGTSTIHHLILFPSHLEPNLTEYKESLLSAHIGIASPKTKKEYSYLVEDNPPNVYTFEEFQDALENTTVFDGTKESTIQSVMGLKGIGVEPLFHIISEFEYSYATEYPELTKIGDNLLREGEFTTNLNDELSYQYIPVTGETASLLQLLLTDSQATDPNFCRSKHSAYEHSYITHQRSIYSLYTRFKLAEFQSYPEAKYFLEKDNDKFTEKTASVIDRVAESLHREERLED